MPRRDPEKNSKSLSRPPPGVARHSGVARGLELDTDWGSFAYLTAGVAEISL